MSHAAQCMLCQHARYRGRTVVACDAFEDANVPEVVVVALTSLIWRAAATAPCAIRAAYQAGPDAYLADDLPTEPLIPTKEIER